MFSLLGVPISSLNKAEIESRITTILANGERVHVATINPEFLVRSARDFSFLNLLQSSFNVVDGVGISFWSDLLYKKSVHRYQGVQLAEKICEIATKLDKKVALVGGIDVADGAGDYLHNKFGLKVVYNEDGSPKEVSDELINTQPEVLLVAFGSPAQEFFIAEAFSRIASLQVAIGVGGTFDFWTGKVKRAPVWIQNFGFEWLFRLIKQPWRIKRIFTAVFTFSFLVLKEKVGNMKK